MNKERLELEVATDQNITRIIGSLGCLYLSLILVVPNRIRVNNNKYLRINK